MLAAPLTTQKTHGCATIDSKKKANRASPFPNLNPNQNQNLYNQK
jgi:hypothetical protein